MKIEKVLLNHAPSFWMEMSFLFFVSFLFQFEASANGCNPNLQPDICFTEGCSFRYAMQGDAVVAVPPQIPFDIDVNTVAPDACMPAGSRITVTGMGESGIYYNGFGEVDILPQTVEKKPTLQGEDGVEGDRRFNYFVGLSNEKPIFINTDPIPKVDGKRVISSTAASSGVIRYVRWMTAEPPHCPVSLVGNSVQTKAMPGQVVYSYRDETPMGTCVDPVVPSGFGLTTNRVTSTCSSDLPFRAGSKSGRFVDDVAPATYAGCKPGCDIGTGANIDGRQVHPNTATQWMRSGESLTLYPSFAFNCDAAGVGEVRECVSSYVTEGTSGTIYALSAKGTLSGDSNKKSTRSQCTSLCDTNKLITWTDGGRTCSATTSSVGNEGSEATLINTVASYVGSATVRCDDLTNGWRVVSSSCALPVTCGSASGSLGGPALSVAPTTNLCSDGSTPAVTAAAGSYSWTCGAQSCSVQRVNGGNCTWTFNGVASIEKKYDFFAGLRKLNSLKPFFGANAYACVAVPEPCEFDCRDSAGGYCNQEGETMTRRCYVADNCQGGCISLATQATYTCTCPAPPPTSIACNIFDSVTQPRHETNEFASSTVVLPTTGEYELPIVYVANWLDRAPDANTHCLSKDAEVIRESNGSQLAMVTFPTQPKNTISECTENSNALIQSGTLRWTGIAGETVRINLRSTISIGDAQNTDDQGWSSVGSRSGRCPASNGACLLTHGSTSGPTDTEEIPAGSALEINETAETMARLIPDSRLIRTVIEPPNLRVRYACPAAAPSGFSCSCKDGSMPSAGSCPICDAKCTGYGGVDMCEPL